MRIERGRLLGWLLPPGLVGALLGGVWLLHHGQISTLREQIELRERSLDQMRSEAREAPSVTPPRDRPPRDLDVAVPTRPDLGALLEQLGEDLAAESLDVQQLEASSVIEGSDFDRIPITLQCEGSYDSLFGLLRRIEANPRIIRVDRIDLNGSSLERDDPLLIDMNLSAFCRRPAREGAS